MSGVTIIKVMEERSEHEEQVALFQWRDMILPRYPALKRMHAIPNAFKRTPQQGNWLNAEGMMAGVLDIFLPAARRGYHGLYIEMKVKKRKMTEDQVSFANDVLDEGYCVALCYGCQEAQSRLLWYLK